MTTLSSPRTLGDLLRRLGDIPPDRVRFRPAPGTAVAADAANNKLCELIDGTLVEKVMGWQESYLTLALAEALRAFLRQKRLGVVTGPDSTQQIAPDLVRIPDLSYFSWERLPNRRIPTEPVPQVVPDLVVEVLRRGNTAGEMARKREEFFRAGTRSFWQIDPTRRTIAVFTSPTESTTLGVEDTLTAEEILPGFAYSVADLFAELDRTGP